MADQQDHYCQAKAALPPNPNPSSAAAPGRSGDRVMELLWQDGQVVMQGKPSHKKPPHEDDDDNDNDDHHHLHIADSVPPIHLNHHDPVTHPHHNDCIAANNNLFIQEDEMATWLLSDFCSDLLLLPPSSASPLVPPPPAAPPPPRRFESFGHFSRLSSPRATLTVVDSSDTPMVAGASDNAAACHVARVGDSATRDLAVTSSSRTSIASTEPIPPMKIQKAAPPLPSPRKTTADDVGGGGNDVGEDVHLFLKEGKRPRGSSSAKKSRAAEVHNLSERRRRDRINEKMRTLQELIPHSGKADKASMLDEVIEYLKSLQAQVQMMSMGCSTMPMVFPYPGLQQYMPHMGMGMGLGVGMGMGMGMNRPIMQFPHVFHGSTLPNGGAGPLMCPSVRFPAFQIPPHMPAPNPSTVPSPNQHDSDVLSSVPPQNQPRTRGFLDPYQHFLGLQHAFSGTSSSDVATTSKAGEDSQKTSPD